MKTYKFIATLFIMMVAFNTGCKKDSVNTDNNGGNGGGNNIGDVRVTTYTLREITATSAVCGGDAIVTQGLSLTEIGVCWNTERNPTVECSHLSTTEWSSPYVCTITGLEPETKYYVRAYALCGLEYYYGYERSFTTSPDLPNPTAPVGAIDGLFTINDYGGQVYFSQGNLQYQASTDTWRFAEHQWDFVGSTIVEEGEPGGTIPGSSNHLISEIYDGWIDLFGWGTGNNPTNASAEHQDYSNFNDWGNNPISNGGNMPNVWRTMTKDEWVYIFNTRNTTSGIRYAKAVVNEECGVVLLPDNWDNSTYSLLWYNSYIAFYGSNIISLSDWNTKLEANGAVFLPAAGSRYATNVFYVGSDGAYWSSTKGNGQSSYHLWFKMNEVLPAYYSVREGGQSVRLICSVE